MQAKNTKTKNKSYWWIRGDFLFKARNAEMCVNVWGKYSEYTEVGVSKCKTTKWIWLIKIKNKIIYIPYTSCEFARLLL